MLGLDVKWLQGFTGNGVALVDSNTVCYSSANYVCFLDLETKECRELQSPGYGIDALTANSNNGVFAFSDQSQSPSIFVYTYPDLQLKNELRESAHNEYKSLALSNDGSYLACCSSFPANTISVWVVGLPATDGSFIEQSVQTSDGKKLSFIGPAKYLSAIPGLTRDSALNLLFSTLGKTRLTLTAICWKNRSEIYVGCAEGFLLLVDTKHLSASIAFNPTAANAVPELKQINFRGLAFHKSGLIAVGKENVVCVQMKGAEVNVAKTWQLEGPVSAVMSSPDSETLVLSSDAGQIYTLTPNQSDQIVKVLDVLSGNFVAAAFLHTDKNICVSVKESGELQLWSEGGTCIGSVSLQAEVTSLACCPAARYAAVGTAAGFVLFIDLSREQQPRLVHQVLLYDVPVGRLVFDQEGHYLLTGASDSHIYVLDAKPSKRFACLGCTVAPGPILSLSTQCIRDCKKVDVLALCTGQQDQNQDGSLLAVFSLPMRDLTGPDCVDQCGFLSARVLQTSTFKVPHPLQSCVLGVNEVFTHCDKQRSLQKFLLPQVPGNVSEKQVVQLEPAQEVEGHPLGPASLALSPHQLWLASVCRDGLLRIRETASMETYVELRCNSNCDGGLSGVSFSADSQTIVVTGCRDGSLLCCHVRIKGVVEKHGQPKGHLVESNTENAVLTDLPDWGQESPADAEKPSDLTWLQSRHEAAKQEDNKINANYAKEIEEHMQEMLDYFQQMKVQKESTPERERLHWRKLILDVDHQNIQDAIVEQEITQVKDESKKKTEEICCHQDAVRAERDSLKVKNKVIKPFHAGYEVENYPLKEASEKEVEDLRRVENIRKTEIAACKQSDQRENSNISGKKQEKKEMKEKREKQEKQEKQETSLEAESAAESESLSSLLGCSNPYLYSQFRMKTTEQRFNQLILLQDVIRRIATAFDEEFDAMHGEKMQELNRVEERNQRIREITSLLGVQQELWQPSMSFQEDPDRFLREIDAEKNARKQVTPEEEARRRAEEQRRLAAEERRKQDLEYMMGGMLESKDAILKKQIPVPKFVSNKPETDWSETERRAFRDYEKKIEDLNEEKEKYKKTLHIEMARLQAANKEVTEQFDVKLKKLFEKKLQCDCAIKQERLNILHLTSSVKTEEQIRNKEQEFKSELKKSMKRKAEISKKLKKYQAEEELLHEAYDRAVAEGNLLDKNFKQDLSHVPMPVVNSLYQSFKLRPGMKNQSKAHGDQHQCGSVGPNAPCNMLAAMDRLDAPANMPKGTDQSTWKKFCLIRRTKIENEHQVKAKSVALTEKQSLLQGKIKEEKAAQQEIQNISDELESLSKEKNQFLINNKVQVLLKQGQVEVPTEGLTPDYTDSTLLPRKVVEDYNTPIRNYAKKEQAGMKRNDCMMAVVQQWELKKLSLQIEDLRDKERQIRKLRLSEAQMDYLKNPNPESREFNQICDLEKVMAHNEKIHLDKLRRQKKDNEEFNIKATREANRNAIVTKRIHALELEIPNLKNSIDAMVSDESIQIKEKEHRKEALMEQQLEDQVYTTEQEVVLLQAETGRSRRRNFPSLTQMDRQMGGGVPRYLQMMSDR